METILLKTCSKCGEAKELTHYHKYPKGVYGVRAECKDCITARRHSKGGTVKQMYLRQKASSKQRGYALPNYTEQDLKQWLFAQPLFHEMYASWVASNYEKGLKPSVDRLDDYAPYTLDSIQLVTFQTNRDNYEQHRKEGKSTKGLMKAVDKLNLDGEMIERYHSISAASRANNNLHIGTIQSVCSGKTKTCGGFKWRYSLEPNNNKH